jgi:hypothetical protein
VFITVCSMKVVHRGELMMLLQNASCLKNCKIVGGMAKSAMSLGERPSVETLALTLNSIEERDRLSEGRHRRRPRTRYVACIDPEMPWIRIQEDESACITRTTSVETESKCEDDPAQDASRMRQEMDELKGLFQQLLLSKST